MGARLEFEKNQEIKWKVIIHENRKQYCYWKLRNNLRRKDIWKSKWNEMETDSSWKQKTIFLLKDEVQFASRTANLMRKSKTYDLQFPFHNSIQKCKQEWIHNNILSNMVWITKINLLITWPFTYIYNVKPIFERLSSCHVTAAVLLNKQNWSPGHF